MNATLEVKNLAGDWESRGEFEDMAAAFEAARRIAPACPHQKLGKEDAWVAFRFAGERFTFCKTLDGHGYMTNEEMIGPDRYIQESFGPFLPN